MTKKGKTEVTEETKIDPAVAEDVDMDGRLDLNPLKAEQTVADLVILDHRLRDEGSSIAELLKAVARTSAGIHL